MRGLRLLLFLAVGAFPGLPAAWAAEVSAELDRTAVRVGEQVVLTVVAVGAARSVPEVDLKSLGADFDVYAAGQSQSISFVNGKMSAQTSRRYVLQPKREGSFTIGPLEVRLGNDILETPPLSLTVGAAAPAPTPPPTAPDERGTTRGSEDLFVRATVDKASAFVYEQVTLRIRLYTRVDLLDNPGYSPPATEGFWKEDLPPPEPVIETVNGKRYRVLEVRSALFPTRPGDLSVGEAVLECTVADRSDPDPFSFFGRSFRDGKRIVLRSDPVSVSVKPLPPGPPPSFQGAVGDYRLSVTADRRELNQTEPLTLTVQVSGQGHLRTVGEVGLPSIPGFRSYPSTANQEQSPQGGRIRGSLTQQFVLVPLRAGELEVPPVEFTYFSPAEGAYRTVRSEPLTVRASAGAVESGGSARGEIEVVGRDIRFLETEVPRFRPPGGAWQAARPWLAALLLPLAGSTGFWGWETQRRRQGKDRAGVRRNRAARRARARLKEARGRESAAQASAAGNALRGYVADRFDLAEAGLTPERIRTALGDRGVDVGPVLEWIERTDAARYAPVEPTGVGWVEDALALIDRLERAT